MGRRRNELKNAAGLILKLRIIVAVQDLKFSFYMQILVSPHFWLVPPHFVCSGNGTGYTVRFFHETLTSDFEKAYFFY